MPGEGGDPALGERIRAARHRLRLSQEQLAQAIGVSVRSVRDWEAGRHYPRWALGALEDVLGAGMAASQHHPRQQFDDPDEQAIWDTMTSYSPAERWAVIHGLRRRRRQGDCGGAEAG